MGKNQPDSSVITAVGELLERFQRIKLAVVFGSMAGGKETTQSDLDLAVQADTALTLEERIEITEALAITFNRPIDLVDLRTAGQPLLDQVITGGVQVAGERHQWGDLVYRNIIENEDFVPYQKRILKGRRDAWMSNS
ncbi:MAG: DNA polymerase III subunit beta [Oceanospirillaceae bacterium]|nr:DNA polymerase III subunit beta [Oceanospirillaceae bacterium]|tara:strand:+ start:38 stop:451 length:414 start_codon:yes stop_codon:yes gene_type:complete